jgi:hypothetical protein
MLAGPHRLASYRRQVRRPAAFAGLARVTDSGPPSGGDTHRTRLLPHLSAAELGG